MSKRTETLSRARLNALLDTALSTRVPRVSWLVAEGGKTIAARKPEQLYSGASMIKTFLLVAALERVERGELNLGDDLEVRTEHVSTGDGILRRFETPLRLRFRDLLLLMMTVSDNTATNAVLEAIGLEKFNEWLAERGYETRMRAFVDHPERPYSRRAEIGAGFNLMTPVGLSMTSAAEHHDLLGRVKSGGLLPKLGSTAFEYMSQQQDRRSLARYVGEEVWFAHKTGTVAAVRHDAGMIKVGGRALDVSVFTDGGPEEEWVDHPAAVGMGLAMAWLAEELGLEIAAPPGTPLAPRVLIGPTADLGWDQMEAGLRTEDAWASIPDPSAELGFWKRGRNELDSWSKAIWVNGTIRGLVCLYERSESKIASVGICVHDLEVDREGAAREAVGLAGQAASARGIDRLEWRTYADNEPSNRLAQSCGFGFVGTAPTRTRNGRSVDETVWTLELGGTHEAGSLA